MGSSQTMVLVTVLSFAFLLSRVIAESNPCSPPWVDGSSVGMGCLLFDSETASNFYDADIFCQSTQDAKLVSIDDADQHDFVKMIIGFLSGHESTHEWWTSGSDQGRESEFY